MKNFTKILFVSLLMQSTFSLAQVNPTTKPTEKDLFKYCRAYTLEAINVDEETLLQVKKNIEKESYIRISNYCSSTKAFLIEISSEMPQRINLIEDFIKEKISKSASVKNFRLEGNADKNTFQKNCK
jgi:hypothetical protein